MKFTTNREHPKAIRFGDLDQGEIFIYDTIVMMKIAEVINPAAWEEKDYPPGLYNAVDLENGKGYEVDYDAEVIVPKYELIITDSIGLTFKLQYGD